MVSIAREHLETISSQMPLKVWGYGGHHLPNDSNLRLCWQGEAWAEDMYSLLATSKITINRHIDIAERYANNMRLFEATGMGCCLLTDNKCNLPELFEPDHEVITYKSATDAIGKIRDLQNSPTSIKTIAENGQLRVLKDHTYSKRMSLLCHLINKRINPVSQVFPYSISNEKTIVISIDFASQKFISLATKSDERNDNLLFVVSEKKFTLFVA